MGKLMNEVIKFRKELIKTSLDSLPKNQSDFFLRIFQKYGKTTEEILDNAPEDRIVAMIGLIERTMDSNKCGQEKKN